MENQFKLLLGFLSNYYRLSMTICYGSNSTSLAVSEVIET